MMKSNISIRQNLINKLKDNHCFWSYDNNSIIDVPDDVLVELVMVHLDLKEIDDLFILFSFDKIKKIWRENLALQGERYRTLNLFLAWYYFNIKDPRRYLKYVETVQLKRKLGYYD